MQLYVVILSHVCILLGFAKKFKNSIKNVTWSGVIYIGFNFNSNDKFHILEPYIVLCEIDMETKIHCIATYIII